jgi:hypothetical protein
MSNIKKALYTIAIKPLNPKLSVIKVTGTSKNIKQINWRRAYKVQALLLFVKAQVELSPLPNFRQQRYSFMHIYRLCTTTV